MITAMSFPIIWILGNEVHERLKVFVDRQIKLAKILWHDRGPLRDAGAIERLDICHKLGDCAA